MIKLVDNRPNPYQWDTNAEVEFDGVCDQFHFANRVYGRSINVNAEQKDGKSKCLIPIQLLQTANDLNVYVFVGRAESGQTKVEHTFKVIPRNKPNDYVFTPAEQMTIEEIEKIANEAMQKSINAEKIAQSVRDDADAGKFKGDKGDKGEQGDSGVYVGSDPVPDGTKVQVDPQGDVIKIPDRTSDLINDSGFTTGEVWETLVDEELTVDTDFREYDFSTKPLKKVKMTIIGKGKASDPTKLYSYYLLNGNSIGSDILLEGENSLGYKFTGIFAPQTVFISEVEGSNIINLGFRNKYYSTQYDAYASDFMTGGVTEGTVISKIAFQCDTTRTPDNQLLSGTTVKIEGVAL